MNLFETAFSQDSLELAWHVTRRKARSAGIDGVTTAMFSRDAPQRLRRLRRQILSGTYSPLPAIPVHISKPAGGTRTIEILSLTDRIAQRACLASLNLAFDGAFSDGCFSFRPRRGVHGAVHRVHQWRVREKVRCAARADVESCFDSINHDRILSILRDRWADVRLRSFISACIKAPDRQARPREVCVPQGAPLSPFLCNLALDSVDWAHEDCRYIRYADDFCIGCRTRSDANQAIDRLESELGRVDLRLNPKKTQVATFRNGFRFLGGEFHHYGVRPIAWITTRSGRRKRSYAYEGEMRSDNVDVAA